MSYLIVDFGTSSCRASLVSNEGKIIAEKREPVAIVITGNKAEINPEYAFSLVVRVVRALLSENPKEYIQAVGIGAMLGYVFLNKKNQTLRPAILWMDNRAGKEMEAFKLSFSEEELYRISGRKMSPELLGPKLLWLRKNEPETFDCVHKIIGLKDYFVFRLTGEIATDYAHLNYSMLFDVKNHSLHTGLCTVARVDSGLFPPVHYASDLVGCISGSDASESGIPGGVPVICGSTDGTTAMYGGGLLLDGAASFVSGTTDVLMTLSARYIQDPSFCLSINTGMVPGTYAVGGAMGLSGGALSKLKVLFGMDIEALLPQIEDIPPGSEGLKMITGLSGERSPYWKDDTRGCLHGLGLHHSQAHILRAFFEATSYRVKRLIDVLKSNGLIPERIHLVGGGAVSDVVNKLRSDVTGLESVRLKVKEATTLGTALYCAVGTKEAVSLTDASVKWIAPDRYYTPDRITAAVYERLAADYNQWMFTRKE